MQTTILKYLAVVLALLNINIQSTYATDDELEVHSSQGTLQYIDQGDVLQLPNSEFFVVRERHIGGTLKGSIGGTEGVPYLITYKSYVPISTQSGPVSGRIESLNYELYFRGQSYLGPTPLPCPVPDGQTCIATPNGNFIPGLWMDGKGYFRDGAKGTVEVSLWLIPILDEAGHIAGIYDSDLTLTGKWKPEPWQLQGRKR